MSLESTVLLGSGTYCGQPALGTASRWEPVVSCLLQRRPFLRHLARSPLQICAGTLSATAQAMETYQELLDALCMHLDVCAPVLKASSNGEISALEELIGEQILAALEAIPVQVLRAPGAIEEAAECARAQYSQHRSRQRSVIAPDGTALTAYAHGRPSNRAVVIIGPCGIPTSILDRWVTALSKHYFVLTCESRGFAATDTQRMDHDFTLETQARDVLALLDHAQVERAHLMGICGGAVVALCSGCLDPERIVSLSLWHGDFNTGDGELLTRYQADLRWLMSEAAESRESAIALQNTLNNRNALARIRRELAHFLFYPYTNGELLYRYARANGAIMHADVMKYADRIHQKTLVVASEDDQTAHPMGSKRVCARLRNAQLSMTHGQHLCYFDALEPAQRLAEAFIAESFK